MRIFVVGSARTGTTWMGQILSSHPEIAGIIEDPMTFQLAVESVMLPSPTARLATLGELIRRYRVLGDLASPRRLAVKDHPLLWHVEEIIEELPDSYFIAMTRDVLPTVASMLKHGAVLAREERVPETYPLPMVGFSDPYTLNWFTQASVEERCAARWAVHTREVHRLFASYPTVVVCNYTRLVQYTEGTLEAVRRALLLNKSFTDYPEANPGTLEKWKGDLTDEQVERITGTVAMAELTLQGDRLG